VLPVILWEISPWIGDPIRKIIQNRQKIRGPRSPILQDLGSVIFLPAAAAVVVAVLFPCQLPGWDSAASEAISSSPVIEEQVDTARMAPAGILFVDYSAVPWFIDRPVVWSPSQEATRKRICEFLDQTEVKP